MNKAKRRRGLGDFFSHLKIQEQINFARHIAIMIEAGLPIYEALKILRRQTQSKKLVKILDQVIVDVSNGQSLADSLEARGSVFGDFFINIVRVGESSGTLAKNFLYLAEELRKAKTLHAKIRSAMVYPLVILVATIAIVGVLVFFIFPKLLPVFGRLKVELPLTTKILIAVSSFLLNYWYAVILAVIVGIIVVRLLLLLTSVRMALQTVTLYIPVVSSLVIHVNIANFSRVMGVLLKSGIKIVQALQVTGSTFSNLIYRRALMEAAMHIEQGDPLAQYLARNKKIFPPLVASLIEIGENTGNLEDNLFYLADYYTEELDNSIKNLTVFIEPILLLVMGMVVGFVAISIITPIYSLSQGIG